MAATAMLQRQPLHNVEPLPVGNGNGLGWVSTNEQDLFRPLQGFFANRDPHEMKPPKKVFAASDADLAPAHYPVGVVTIRMRMLGDGKAICVAHQQGSPVDWRNSDDFYVANDVVKGPFMPWAICEAIADTVSKVAKVNCKGHDVLLMSDKPEILQLTMPTCGQAVWQFVDFRIGYKIRMSAGDGSKAALNFLNMMVDFEAYFCKALEMKYRDVYHLTIVGLLNKKNTLVDGQKLSDEIALFEAAGNGDLDKLSSLLNNMTRVNAVQTVARCPRRMLNQEQQLQLLDLGRTPLLAAADGGRAEALKLLLHAQADVNFKDSRGFSALYLASAAEDGGKCIQLLLDWGAELHGANTMGYTPLHNACGAGDEAAVRTLLAAKADLNLKSKSGAAPLHAAVICDQPDMLKVLKELGANLNMPALGGNTAVHEAVMLNNGSMIKTLSQLGADVNIESGPAHGFATPLRMAQERRKKKAIKALTELKALEEIEHEYEVDADGNKRVVGRLY